MFFLSSNECNISQCRLLRREFEAKLDFYMRLSILLGSKTHFLSVTDSEPKDFLVDTD